MLRVFTAAAVAAVVPILLAPPAKAETCELTLERALEIARERAPAIVAARTRIDEARARLKGASVLLRENPELEGDAGPRLSSSGDSTDVRARLSQALELGGARTARIAGAEADVAQRIAGADDAQRQALRAVAIAFLRTRAADDDLTLSEGAARVAEDLLGSTERRHRAGDIAILDVNVARAAVGRAHADVAAARATRRDQAGKLALLLAREGDAPPRPCGQLRDRARLDLAELLRDAPGRPDLRALAAEIEEAEADQKLGAARAWPAVRIGTEYKREQGDDIYLGGLSLSLPLFQRGQSERAEAEARARRLRQERAAAEQAASAEVRTAWEVYRELDRAAEELERETLAVVGDSEVLAQRSYDAGELSLAELLVLRRETFEVRRAYVESALQAALAEIELESAAGVLR